MVEKELLERFGRVYQTEEIIFCEHEPGNEMYIIASGQVKISKITKTAEIVLSLLGPGDIIGEMALIDHKPRSANAVTTECTEVIVLTAENFEQILAKKPQFLVELIQILCNRIWFTSRQIQNMTLKSAQGKVGGMIALLAEIHKKKPDQNTGILLSATSKDLSQMAGIELDEADSIVKELERKGLIKVEEGLITVNDLKNLKVEVEFDSKKERFKTIGR